MVPRRAVTLRAIPARTPALAPQLATMSKNENELQAMLDRGEYPSLDLAYEESQRNIDRQLSDIDAIDVKASLFIAASGIDLSVMLPTFPALVPIINIPAALLTLITTAAALCAIAAGLRAVWINDYKYPGDIQTLIQKYLSHSERRTKYQLLFEAKDIFLYNQRFTKGKASWLRRSFYALLTTYLSAALTLCYVAYLIVNAKK